MDGWKDTNRNTDDYIYFGQTNMGFPNGSMAKKLLAGVRNSVPGQEDPLEKEMATHSNILAWEIPWTEEPDGLHSSWDHKESDVNEWLTLSTFSFYPKPTSIF